MSFLEAKLAKQDPAPWLFLLDKMTSSRTQRFISTFTILAMQVANATLHDTNSFLEAELAKRDAEAMQLRAKLHPEAAAAAEDGTARGSPQYETMKERLQQQFSKQVQDYCA